MGSVNVISSKNAMKQWRERQSESPLIDQRGLVAADPREPHVPLTYSPSRQSDDDDTAIVGAFLLGSLF